MIKKRFLPLLLLAVLLMATTGRALANEFRGGFFTALSSEAVFFSKTDDTASVVAPAAAIVVGYQGKNFSATGGYHYYFNNFYGARDLLIHFGADYKLRFKIAGDSFLSLAVGANLARNIFAETIRGIDETTYFFMPSLGIDFAIGSFLLTINHKTYLPIKSSPKLAYSIGGGLGFIF